jgi:hypothetical protein
MRILIVLIAGLAVIAGVITGVYASMQPLDPVHQAAYNDAHDRVMRAEALTLAQITREHPALWKTEHPLDYSALLGVMAQSGYETSDDATKLAKKDQGASQDYQILVIYREGSRVPVLSNARIEVGDEPGLAAR